MNGKMKQKGITLIALVVTILILLVLAGITINLIFGTNGIIARVQSAIENNNRAIAREAVAMGWLDCRTGYMLEGAETQKQTYFEENIKICIDRQNKDGEYVESGSTIDVSATSTVNYAYKDKIYIFYVDADGNVTYAGNKDQGQKEDVPRVEPEETTYKLTGEIYCNSPDLSGFAKDATYYVTYDSEGNEQIAGRIDTINAPEDWYNYSEKRWANIVTITNNQVAYWVWIPKYVYKLNTSAQTVETYFVSQETTANATEYIYKTKDGEQTISASEYSMPESFKFDGKELAGFWTSKYELSESISVNTQTIDCRAYTNKIIISTNNPSGEYTVFVEGEEKYKGTLPYTLENLAENASYDICIISNTAGPIGRKVVWTRDLTEIEVDTSGFSKENTFYVTYDENGNESYRRLDKGVPVDWYDYTEKKWANLVTVNENQVAYWTYVPRYEYIANSAAQSVDIKFIPKTQTTPDIGYTIPESFTFDGKDLAGFWTSKYELSESISVNTQTIDYRAYTNKITISTNNPSGEYTVFVEGEEKYKGTLPYTLENLAENASYDICIISNTAGPIGRKVVWTRDLTEIEVDTSGFNEATTFYVLYSTDGQTIESENIPISQTLTSEQKEKWYNYSLKRWANIKTVSEDGSLTAYWTYIPRYEYITNSAAQSVDIKFIPKTQTTPDIGYTIPESFTFDGKELAGFWSSKYELSE